MGKRIVTVGKLGLPKGVGPRFYVQHGRGPDSDLLASYTVETKQGSAGDPLQVFRVLGDASIALKAEPSPVLARCHPGRQILAQSTFSPLR